MSEVILPFPKDIDRDAFGHWLSGFTDGEGCFFLGWTKRYTANSTHNTPRARFQILLRSDEYEVLGLIRSYFGCGNVFRHTPDTTRSIVSKPGLKFTSERIADLAHILVPHYDTHPLMAKKSRDFRIWREGVMFLNDAQQRPQGNGSGNAKRYSIDQLAYYESLVRLLRKQREFSSDIIEIPTAPRIPQLSLFH